jgi:hypothetical protein
MDDFVTRWSEKMELKEDLLATYISQQRMFASVQCPLSSQAKGLLTPDGLPKKYRVSPCVCVLSDSSLSPHCLVSRCALRRTLGLWKSFKQGIKPCMGKVYSGLNPSSSPVIYESHSRGPYASLHKMNSPDYQSHGTRGHIPTLVGSSERA